MGGLLVGDSNASLIHIQRSKGGKPRGIPFTDEGKMKASLPSFNVKCDYPSLQGIDLN